MNTKLKVLQGYRWVMDHQRFNRCVVDAFECQSWQYLGWSRIQLQQYFWHRYIQYSYPYPNLIIGLFSRINSRLNRLISVPRKDIPEILEYCRRHFWSCKLCHLMIVEIRLYDRLANVFARDSWTIRHGRARSSRSHLNYRPNFGPIPHLIGGYFA